MHFWSDQLSICKHLSLETYFSRKKIHRNIFLYLVGILRFKVTSLLSPIKAIEFQKLLYRKKRGDLIFYENKVYMKKVIFKYEKVAIFEVST